MKRLFFYIFVSTVVVNAQATLLRNALLPLQKHLEQKMSTALKLNALGKRSFTTMDQLHQEVQACKNELQEMNAARRRLWIGVAVGTILANMPQDTKQDSKNEAQEAIVP